MKGSVKIIVFKNMDEILKIVILKKSGVFCQHDWILCDVYVSRQK